MSMQISHVRGKYILTMAGILVAASIEFWFLFKIIHHPAGGWGSRRVGPSIGINFAAATLYLGYFSVLWSKARYGPNRSMGGWLLVGAWLGVLFSYLALAEYGVGTIFFLVVGILVQVICGALALGR